MKKYIKYLRKDRIVLGFFVFSFILLILNLIFLIFNYSKLPPLLPIFNQLPWGEQRLIQTPGIFIPYVLAIIIFVLNLFLSAYNYEKYPLLARLFAVTTMLTSLLILLFEIRTVTLII